MGNELRTKPTMSSVLASKGIGELSNSLSLTPEQINRAKSSALQLSSDPKLAKCDPFSIAKYCFETARYNFTRDDCIYPVPYNDKIQAQMGYKGFRELCLKAGYKEISSVPVYSCDRVYRDRETGQVKVEFNEDYNSKIIKICLFLFTFALFLVINALFFNDSTMHKIYELKGNYNFINQMPIIFYSSIISSFISIIIKYLSLSEADILKLKFEVNAIKEKSKKILNCLIAKFTLFFILTFILLFLFWYYISCFCAIYRNTQIHLIKDTLISYGLSLLYPFAIYLIPGIFRIPSLRSRKKDKECLFRFSKILHSV